MTKPILWVAWMARWGSPSPSNAYAASVHDCPHAAKAAGEAESQCRGGKYAFQHCPSRLDFDEPEAPEDLRQPWSAPPERVVVASVRRGDLLNATRCHFLGVFTTEQQAGKVKAALYPGWKLDVEWHSVTVTHQPHQEGHDG